MKKWIEKIKDGLKSGKINIRIVVIAIVIVACVVGTIAATQISSEPAIKLTADGNETTEEPNDSGKTSSDTAKNKSEDDSTTDAKTQSSSKEKTNLSSSKESSETSSDSSSGTSDKKTNQSGNSSQSTDGKTNNSTNQSNQSNQSETITDVKNISCTIEIRCDSVSGNGVLTANGHPELESYAANPQIINTTVTLAEGSSGYDALIQACNLGGIQVESVYTPAYKTYYIQGINYLYEFSAGSTSGWKYLVNGTSPNYGCSSYKIKDGDVITFKYVTSY